MPLPPVDGIQNPEEVLGMPRKVCRFTSQIEAGLRYRAILQKSKENTAKVLAGPIRRQKAVPLESGAWRRKTIKELARLIMGIPVNESVSKKWPSK